MNVEGICIKYRLAKLISAAAVSLSVAALPALAGEAPPTGHGGGGIISGNNCFKTNSKNITEVCADYKVSWKLWILMGEPVGDYKLKWELRNFTVSGGKSLVTYNAGQDIPPVLANEAKSIELYLDAIASVGLGTAAFAQQPLAFHAFNTGVATRAGQLSYNTPGSPKWSEVFQHGWGFVNARRLSESEAKDIFKRSNQPDLPIQLYNLQIGPKSSVMELGALESRIAQLCASPDTAPSYAFCPAIKKPEEKKADKKNPIEDAFADLEKTKPVVPPKPVSSVKDKTAKADKVVDDGFADVDAHRAKPVPPPAPPVAVPTHVQPTAPPVVQAAVEVNPHIQFGEAAGLTWVWFKQPEPQKRVPNNHGGTDAVYSYNSLIEYCRTEIGGQSGWRLPTMSELEQLNSTDNYRAKVWRGALDLVMSSDEVDGGISSSDRNVRHYEKGRFGIEHGGYYTGSETSKPDKTGIYNNWVCVHSSLASNESFTKRHRICYKRDECPDPK